jgi:hypothetical protein
MYLAGLFPDALQFMAVFCFDTELFTLALVEFQRTICTFVVTMCSTSALNYHGQKKRTPLGTGHKCLVGFTLYTGHEGP